MTDSIENKKPAHETYILADLPTDTDALDFSPYVNTLVNIIRSENTATPLTIGVFGTWGSGKTSLMRMVQKQVATFPTIWFDAWKYDKEEALWRALLLQVIGTVRTVLKSKTDTDKDALATLDDLEASLYRVVEREELGNLQVDWQQLAKGSLETAVQVGIALIPGLHIVQAVKEALGEEAGKSGPGKLLKAVERAKTQIYAEHIRSLEQFQREFQRIVTEHVPGKLVVFIDDLDRCVPEKALEVLETIKLFLDVQGCLFVLGLDQDVIARGVELKYRELGLVDDSGKTPRYLIDGTRYLEKIIQLPFQIPPIEQDDMQTFVAGLVKTWPDAACPDVFAAGLGTNPRQVKRAVNVFLLVWNLAQARAEKLQGRIKAVRLAKVVVIQNVYAELYEVLKRTPRLLRDLEDYYRAEALVPREGKGLPAGEVDSAAERRAEPPPALREYVDRQAVRRILTMHPPETPDANFSGLKPDELRLYFTLTRRAEAPQVAPTELPRAAFEPELVAIPAGPFLMGSTDEQIQQVIKDGLDEKWVKPESPQHQIELPRYWIGKYPITNNEYFAFVRAADYKAPKGWENGEPPQDRGDHPVVNVSWEDASAYCQWLSEETGKTYRLPTEAEWEKAARSTDGRVYAWGNDLPTEQLCNFDRNVGGTTPVGQYSPQGDSPYNCADMLGNVWEWTDSWYQAYPGSEFEHEDYGERYRVLRGGAWSSLRRIVRCAFRNRNVPVYFLINVGFRLVSPG